MNGKHGKGGSRGGLTLIFKTAGRKKSNRTGRRGSVRRSKTRRY